MKRRISELSVVWIFLMNLSFEGPISEIELFVSMAEAYIKIIG